MLRCTICASNADIDRQMEHDMSNRLTSSAIFATLMMACLSVYSTFYHSSSESASILTMMGG
tara:strand:- start:438 stop:623 length:186 start_codon:yes stop_codon:yes gene_type:complete